MEKIDGCRNNPENSSKTKASEHVPSGFPMYTICSFKNMENKHDVYRSKDCMKTFCEHAMEIINFKKLILLPNEQHKSDKNCCICKEKINMLKIKI